MRNTVHPLAGKLAPHRQKWSGELQDHKISKNAAWYIALIHVHPVKDADVDYETNWASLTFEMK